MIDGAQHLSSQVLDSTPVATLGGLLEDPPPEDTTLASTLGGLLEDPPPEDTALASTLGGLLEDPPPEGTAMAWLQSMEEFEGSSITALKNPTNLLYANNNNNNNNNNCRREF
jgi:hypothetical protein